MLLSTKHKYYVIKKTQILFYKKELFFNRPPQQQHCVLLIESIKANLVSCSQTISYVLPTQGYPHYLRQHDEHYVKGSYAINIIIWSYILASCRFQTDLTPALGTDGPTKTDGF